MKTTHVGRTCFFVILLSKYCATKVEVIFAEADVQMTDVITAKDNI